MSTVSFADAARARFGYPVRSWQAQRKGQRKHAPSARRQGWHVEPLRTSSAAYRLLMADLLNLMPPLLTLMPLLIPLFYSRIKLLPFWLRPRRSLFTVS